MELNLFTLFCLIVGLLLGCFLVFQLYTRDRSIALTDLPGVSDEHVRIYDPDAIDPIMYPPDRFTPAHWTEMKTVKGLGIVIDWNLYPPEIWPAGIYLTVARFKERHPDIDITDLPYPEYSVEHWNLLALYPDSKKILLKYKMDNYGRRRFMVMMQNPDIDWVKYHPAEYSFEDYAVIAKVHRDNVGTRIPEDLPSRIYKDSLKKLLDGDITNAES